MKWRFRVWLNAMNRRGIDLEQESRVLDVGCGAGTFSRQLERATAWVVDGLDPNRQAIEMNGGGRGVFAVGNLLKLPPLFLKKYDHLFFFDVLEHLPQPKDELLAAARIMKPGGLLHINVPALPFLYSAYDEVQGHQERFTRDRLRALLQGTPFRVVDIAYWGLSLVPFALVRKWLVSGNEDEGKIMQKGFSCGGDFLNGLMNIPMFLETSVCPKTCFGTSLMVLAENAA
ncbi:MAG: class I SAM-dependent methyltransferase [Elusimicrobia bacterium]|nr:class I SAM-dependent methyltransferase [Elusimicrobiota bacterium]